MNREQNVKIFYHPEQSVNDDGNTNISKSPSKPGLLLESLKREGLTDCFTIEGNFSPFSREDFKIAHTAAYVDGFFSGDPLYCETNGLKWTNELANSVRYTNSSLYHAIREAVRNPSVVTLSPTSGFHHAQPENGRSYCTFSGQVISSVMIWREFKIAGAYLDLDGHYGNSIEDSRAFIPELNEAVPPGANINPRGLNNEYVESFSKHLSLLKDKILDGEIGYVVFCHGADSHEYDDFYGQCNTSEWLKCSEMFYQWVQEIDRLRPSPLPVAISLFGGYRSDDFQSVLTLHIADLAICLNVLCGRNIAYHPAVAERAQGR